MQKIDRGAQRRSNPDLFLSHSSKDKDLAMRLATDLNFCGVDAWLDEWEIQIGQSLSDILASAMEKARFVAILISENYNKSVWTKREYKKALSREEQESRIVMLPLILSGAEFPDFLEDKKYVDLRDHYYSGLAQVAGMVHGLSEFRITRALREHPPENVRDIWELLRSVGFEPFVVFGSDDFEEILRYGGERIQEDYAYFYPDKLLDSARVSDHVKSLLREVFPPNKSMHLTADAQRAKAIR
jgi:hypothetical protein